MNRKFTRAVAIIIVAVMALSFLASMILPYII